MRLAMSNIAWTPAERRDAYAAMAEHGVTGLEIAPGLLFHAADDPFRPGEALTRAAVAEIETNGLTIVSMQSLLFGVKGAGLFDGTDARRLFEQGMARAIELAGRLGIPNLVFGSPTQRRIPEGLAREQAWAQAVEVFTQLGDLAIAAGVRISIESNPVSYGTNFLTTLAQVRDFVTLVNHPAILLVLDLGAMHENRDFDTVQESIADIGGQLNHVHVSEPHLAPAPKQPSHVAPVLWALRKAAYDKAVSIEMKRPPDGLVGIRAALRSLASAAAAG